MTKKIISKAAVPIVILSSLLIRLMNIGSADLWRDEAFSVRAANFGFKDMITAIGKDTAPPLHTIILHFWIKLFGYSDISVRMPSLIFGFASIIIFYYLLKLVFKDKKLIISALILFAFNPVLVWYSQEARAYAMMLFFSLTSLYLTVQIINQKKINNISLVALSFTTLLGLYTHNLFIFVGLVNLLLIVFSRYWNGLKKFKLNKEIIKILLAYFIAGIFYLPWFIITLEQLKTVNAQGFWLHFDPILDPVATVGQFFTAENRPDFNNIQFSLVMTPIWIIGGGAFLFSLHLFETKALSKNLKIIFTWFFTSSFLIWLYSFKTSFFYIRYLIFLVPPVLILATNTLGTIRQRSKYIFIILLLILSINSFVLTFKQNQNLKDSKADTVSLVKDIQYKQNDLILHTHAYTHHAFNVYSKLPNQIYNPDNNLPYYEGLSVIKEQDYYKQKEIIGYKRVWVIYLWGERPELTEQLIKNYHLIKTTDYEGNLHMQLWEENT
jgi:mannosyltransferase